MPISRNTTRCLPKAPQTAEAVLDEETAARRLQRAYRLQLDIFRYFGAKLFVMWDGSAACHGMINFVNSLIAQPARFLACSDSASSSYLAHYMTRQWRLAPPVVLITVTGGAGTFELSPQLQSVFSNGLASAATTSRAWVVTGGTDSGVMKMVGAASESRTIRIAPLLVPERRGAWRQ